MIYPSTDPSASHEGGPEGNGEGERDARGPELVLEGDVGREVLARRPLGGGFDDFLLLQAVQSEGLPESPAPRGSSSLLPFAPRDGLPPSSVSDLWRQGCVLRGRHADLQAVRLCR